MLTDEYLGSLKKKRYTRMAEKLAQAMEKRQFEVFICVDRRSACAKALSLIKKGSTVSWGGSTTIDQIGLLDAVRQGAYRPIDRDSAKTPEERMELMRKGLTADCFLMSFNGVSMDGTVYNIDGNGNRVAALAFGPKQVIAVVGMNKVTMSQEEALQRSLGTAAQLNAARFDREQTLFTGSDVTSDEIVKGRICNIVQKLSYCGTPGRIKVILVTEDLGF